MDVENGTLVTNPLYKWALRCTPAIPALRKLEQEDCCNLKASLGYKFQASQGSATRPGLQKMKVGTGKKRKKEKKRSWEEPVSLEGRRQGGAERPG